MQYVPVSPDVAAAVAAAAAATVAVEPAAPARKLELRRLREERGLNSTVSERSLAEDEAGSCSKCCTLSDACGEKQNNILFNKNTPIVNNTNKHHCFKKSIFFAKMFR
jgi:hypothetical protein